MRILGQMEGFRALSFCMKKKTVVPLGNQTERFFLLEVLGNKPRISPRSMVHKYDEGNGFVIFRSFW